MNRPLGLEHMRWPELSLKAERIGRREGCITPATQHPLRPLAESARRRHWETSAGNRSSIVARGALKELQFPAQVVANSELSRATNEVTRALS